MYLLYHHLIVVEISQFCVINVFSFHDMFLSRMMPDVGLSRYCIFTSLFLPFSPVIWLFAMVSLLYSVLIILTDSVYNFYQLLCSIHICYTTLCLSTTLLVCHIKPASLIETSLFRNGFLHDQKFDKNGFKQLFVYICCYYIGSGIYLHDGLISTPQVNP